MIFPLLTLFSLPNDFASVTLAYVGDLATDLKVPIYIVIGIALGMWILNYVIGLFTRRARARR